MKPNLIKALRWIAVVPAFILGAFVVRIMTNWSMMYSLEDDVLDAVNNRGDFGGHYIFGPIYTLMLYASMTVGAIAAALFTAPNGRGVLRIVLTVLVGVFLLVMGFMAIFLPNDEITTEAWVKYVVQNLAIVFGTMASYWLPAGDDRNPTSSLAGS